MEETIKSSGTPKNIGHYEIKAELGRGGMATVYRAYDPRFEREVAIKVLPREFLHDPQFRVRFDREAKTIAALEHSAIVPVYDVGDADGIPYFVMRLMNGGSLGDLLAKGNMTIKETAKIIERIAPALDDAHAKGIIHRDLKPANILFDRNGSPYLSDFGIAKISDSHTNVTGSAIIGTPAYMSPEQAQGHEVDGKSDIYSLGAIIFRMLTGVQPYESDTPMSMAIKHITDPVPDILEQKPDLPPAINSFIQKAMAKDPQVRFQTAQELADALNDLARSGEERTMMSRTRISRNVQSAPQKKKKISWGIIIAGLSVIVIGGGIAGGFLFNGIFSSGRVDPVVTMSPTHTLSPNTVTAIPEATDEQPELASATPEEPTKVPTDTPAPIGPPRIGGADKIAFVGNNNIWVMNVDGSELTQITTDGTVKTQLHWLPDGNTLTYINGKCIWSVDVSKEIVDIVTCYNTAEFVENFTVSPDNQHVVISMNRELYIVPFDVPILKEATTRSRLMTLSGCFFDDLPAKEALWSNDSKKIAIKFLGVSGNTQVDTVRVVDISSCLTANQVIADITPVTLPIMDEFPGLRFTMSGYNSSSPIIPSYNWDGESLFVMNTFKRNDGFGSLYNYNIISHKAAELIPIENTCCYRDARLSPDGSYMIFAFQDVRLGAEAEIELYYVLYGSLGTGATYEPIPLPEGFFIDPRSAPQFALRPAK